MREPTTVRDRQGSEPLAGASLSHEMKTPLAAIHAASERLQKNLQDLLVAAAPRAGTASRENGLLGFLRNALSSPRSHVPATGLDCLRKTDRLEARLKAAGLDARASEAARVILRGGWEEDLAEVLPFLLGSEIEGTLALLDAVGKIRSNLASLEASASALEGISGAAGGGAGPAPSTFDVREAIHSALATLQHQAASATAIETDCEAGLRIAGSRIQFQQVLVNLVANALAAQPPSGGRVGVAAFEADDEIVVRVEDNGSGVPEEIRADLFKPFATSRTDGGGTGLGLFLARKILEEHGGTLRFLPGEGKTVFEARYRRRGPQVRG